MINPHKALTGKHQDLFMSLLQLQTDPHKTLQQAMKMMHKSNKLLKHEQLSPRRIYHCQNTSCYTNFRVLIHGRTTSCNSWLRSGDACSQVMAVHQAGTFTCLQICLQPVNVIPSKYMSACMLLNTCNILSAMPLHLIWIKSYHVLGSSNQLEQSPRPFLALLAAGRTSSML